MESLTNWSIQIMPPSYGWNRFGDGQEASVIRCGSSKKWRLPGEQRSPNRHGAVVVRLLAAVVPLALSLLCISIPKLYVWTH
uniref:Uncharacterized protein n=1 Tax=Kalanchoe fedtschenkoi TaxID=63787 RepID=A0A7N1A9P3_KALFE